MDDQESELARLGRAATSARERLQEFDDSGQLDNLVEHARLKQLVDQADAALRQARRARPLIHKIGNWVDDFVGVLLESWGRGGPH